MSGDAKLRWQVTIWYRSELGALDVQHAVEEIDEIHSLVVAGPDWHTIEKIEIVLARNFEPDLTLEEARNR
jgi:hypothetical protein